ncbi:MAG TPA: hypothetical protein VGX78_16665 [Pirellulales bacterium]|nr:hypothetical protein [Pirellulales bacterium]
MTNDKPMTSLEIFFGDANDAEARVYARMEADDRNADCRLVGRVIGPSCEYAHTLTAAIPLVSKRPVTDGASDAMALLAEAVVPDPCFWSAELPFLYNVEVERRRGADVLATAQRRLGIRRLGVLGRRLVLDGKPWVPRGVDRCEVPEVPLGEWRATDAVMVVDRPSEDLCCESSRLGVLLIAEISGKPSELVLEVRRLARWPSVVIAVLSPNAPLDITVRAGARNLLLAQPVEVEDAVAPAEWADLVTCDVGEMDDPSRWAAGCRLPMIARRPASWRDDLTRARRECDHLQRDLAGHGDFAGYVI